MFRAKIRKKCIPLYTPVHPFHYIKVGCKGDLYGVFITRTCYHDVSVEPAANYIGCYKDTKNRDLAGLLVRVSGNTPQSCIRRCRNKGKKVVWLQNGRVMRKSVFVVSDHVRHKPG